MFANSEDPDEMQHNVAFHQCLHCLLRYKGPSDKNTIFFKYFNLTPLDMYNGLSQVFSIKPEKKSKGFKLV